jgi:hypothetical protein
MHSHHIPKREIEIVGERAGARDHDSIQIRMWINREAKFDSEAHSNVQFRPGVPVEILYGNRHLLDVQLSRSGRVSSIALSHAGAHLDASAFTLRCKEEQLDIRCQIRIDARPRSASEALASTLWDSSVWADIPFPRFSDMLRLRRAMRR